MLPVARVRGRESRRLPLELPAELLCKVVGAAGRTLVCRQLSKELSLVAASQAVSLRFIPSFAQADGEVIPLPSTVVRAVVTWCRALEELSLADAACADDALVSWLLKAAPSLCRLDVSSRKSALTTQSLQLLRAAGPLEWAAAGCWRMHAPNPSLTPYEVLSIQVGDTHSRVWVGSRWGAGGMHVGSRWDPGCWILDPHLDSYRSSRVSHLGASPLCWGLCWGWVMGVGDGGG